MFHHRNGFVCPLGGSPCSRTTLRCWTVMSKGVRERSGVSHPRFAKTQTPGYVVPENCIFFLGRRTSFVLFYQKLVFRNCEAAGFRQFSEVAQSGHRVRWAQSSTGMLRVGTANAQPSKFSHRCHRSEILACQFPKAPTSGVHEETKRCCIQDYNGQRARWHLPEQWGAQAPSSVQTM